MEDEVDQFLIFLFPDPFNKGLRFQLLAKFVCSEAIFRECVVEIMDDWW